MSPKAPSLILDKWFRGFTSLCWAYEPTQLVGRVMGSAHTPKCLHTGRNPVSCLKTRKFSDLAVYKTPKIEFSPAVDFPKNLQKPPESLHFSVYKNEAASPL